MPDPETPEADAAEQAQPLLDEREPETSGSLPEADEGDLAEQLREVPIDDEDYR